MSQPLVFPGWLTSTETAARMSVTINYLNRLAVRGFLIPRVLGRTRLWREKDVEAYILSHPRLGKSRQSVA